MKDVSDGFLLNMAEVSGGLLGLFVVGMLFFAEIGFRRFEGPGGSVVEAYFRSSTRIVLLLFAIPLGLSLTLVVLELGWSRALFALLSVALVAANLDTVRRVRAVQQQTGSRLLLANEVAGTAAVVVLVLLPWILGGLDPSREDLTWAILISFAAAVASVFVAVLSIFDLASED
jgi:Kef-type K+ transport system membrane component KefB